MEYWSSNYMLFKYSCARVYIFKFQIWSNNIICPLWIIRATLSIFSKTKKEHFLYNLTTVSSGKKGGKRSTVTLSEFFQLEKYMRILYLPITDMKNENNRGKNWSGPFILQFLFIFHITFFWQYIFHITYHR